MSSMSMSMSVRSMVMSGLERNMKEIVGKYVKDCCVRNGLNVEEELSKIEGLNIVLSSKISKKEKKVKKSVIPMPFSKSLIKEEGCCGLNYNHGLFTQCEKEKMSNGLYCVTCQSEADKNTSGEPNNGTIGERKEKELYEFKDPKGRKPISYLKVLVKMKLTKEIALEEAKKLNVEINEAHLTELVKEKKITRGRPKKTRKMVEAENVSDLFAKLTADLPSEEEESEIPVNNEVKKKSKKLSEEEKEAKKAKLAEEKEAKKAELEAKKAEEKEAKKAELEAKKLQAKKEREEKRNQEKAEKAAAKKATGKKQEKKEAVKPVEAKTQVEAVKPVEAKTPEKVTVTRATINGKQYLKSSNNILYDPETKEEVGLWDEESKTIKDLPEEEDEEEEEEEEEEYEEDD